MKKNLIIGLLLILVIGITGCSQEPINTPTPGNTQLTALSSDLSGSQELKEFKDINELKEFLAIQNTNSYSGAMYKSTTLSMDTAMVSENGVRPQATGGAAVDYSQTNVQVKGVDEADFVKNDDKYIYMISNNRLVIIDAQDGSESKIISETELSINKNYYNDVREIFLNGDKLMVFTSDYEQIFYLQKYSIEPIQSQRQNTKINIYDVSDRTNPKIVEQINISGTYYSSRMIDNVVYIVSQEGLYDWQYYDGPMIKSTERIISPKIYYFDNQEENYQMNTITSINIEDNNIIDSKAVMLGYSNTLMVSEDNIYIAYQKQNYWCWNWRCNARDNEDRKRFVDVVVPLLEGDIKVKVDAILDKDLPEDQEWIQISQEFNKFYTELMTNEDMQEIYEDNFADIEDALNEYDAKKAIEQSKTTIHRFSINEGNIDYQAKGEVEGRLLNQFSLDEYENNLRVATTTDIWLNRGGRQQYNNVFVLNENLETIGKLKNLAENETIYSTRFMGDKLYMVTFRQIDPFFVIDLSDANSPKVLGYLKIPGYSSYLHPIANDMVIGVGKQTGESQWGGVVTKGVKISLFDVSDFSNPKEIDSYEIGLEGTDSPILHDHKAFMYIPDRNLLVIPVTEVAERIKSGTYNYRTTLWNGAYVFDVSETGFELFGKVKHSSSETQYYSWFNTATVTRSLYIGDSLYTISTQFVKANDLDNDLESLNSITLPSDNNNVDTPIMYVDG
ncbi:MAG: beta-propeller domain-containing protein [Candidatus Woesearchaeota archaeon]